METNDDRYSKLQNRIQEIIKNFAFKYNPIKKPTSRQQDLIRAMILLCHAEFEDYLEETAYLLLKTGEERWDKDKIANKNIAALFLEHDKIDTSETYITKSKQAINDYRKSLKANNGIKNKDISKIFKPLGYKIDDDFEQTFLNDLEALGSHRGEIAHSSSSKKAKTLLDYNDEKNKIERILNEIKDFEDSL